MGAKHQPNPESIIKKYAFDANARILNTIQKLSTQQDNIPPPPIPLAGGGQNSGSGTSFPILYPIIDLGAQGATITINLSNPQSHYQKLEISDPGSNIAVNFNGLITTKAILFTLDIVLTSNLTHSIVWPANLYGIPSTLPTTSGSRYLLEIIGFRSATEERYTVIGVTNASGGGGGFANQSLSNLANPTAINQDLIFGDGKSANAKNIDNVNAIYFKDSGNDGGSPPHNTTSSYILPSGNGLVLDVYLAGFNALSLSTDGTTTGILQVYAKNGVATLKPTSLLLNPTGLSFAELRFDGLNDSAIEKTYSGVAGYCLNDTNGLESGGLAFNISENGTYLEVGRADEFGWNLDENILFNYRHASSFQSGVSYTIDRFTDYWIVITDSVFARNINLPQASTCIGQEFVCSKGAPNSGSNYVYVVPYGTDTIIGLYDSTSPFPLVHHYDTLTVISDGTNWYIKSFQAGSG